MPEESSEPTPPSRGDELALEGILRAEFGRRPTFALHNALVELRAQAAAEAQPGLAHLEPTQPRPFRFEQMLQAFTRHPRRLAVAAVALALLAGGFTASRWWHGRGALEVVAVQGGAARLDGKNTAALAPGMKVVPGQTVDAASNALVRLRYPGEATTIELRGPATLAPQRPDGGKRLRLERGEADIVAAPQPPGRPLRIRAPQGEAEVVGTRFTLAARRASTWLEVSEGQVRLHSLASATEASPASSVLVGADEFAVAAEGIELAARPLTHEPASRPLLPLPLNVTKPWTSGDGDWSHAAGVFRQRRVAMTAWGATPDSKPGGRRYPASEFVLPLRTSGNVMLEATVTLDRLPDDVRPGAGANLPARVGLKLYDRRSVLDFLLSATRPQASQVFAYTEMSEAKGWPSRIIHGGPAPALARATYRLKMRLERLDTGGARVSGKIWQGAVEPAPWLIQGDVPELRDLRSLGLDTMHCAASFTDVRAWLIE